MAAAGSSDRAGAVYQWVRTHWTDRLKKHLNLREPMEVIGNPEKNGDSKIELVGTFDSPEAGNTDELEPLKDRLERTGDEAPGANDPDLLERRLGDRLEKTADEAKMLLRYASMNGLEVPDETAKQICEADARSEAGIPSTSDEEVQFFAAFRELSSLVSPVSVDSLIACDDIYNPEHRSLFTRRRVRRCAAKRASGKFMAITILVLLVLLAVQSYWFVGQRILQQFEEATTALHTREFFASRSGDGSQDGSDNLLAAGVPALTPSRFSNLNEDELRNVISGYGVALGQWSQWLDFLPQPEAATLSQVAAETASITTQPDSAAAPEGAETAGSEDAGGFDDFEIESEVSATAPGAVMSQAAGTNRTYRVMMVGSVLDVMQSFVLPLIYGLIGACAFVLRALVTETQKKTYLPAKAGGYMLRLTLGLLAGLGVGYLFKDQIGGDSALGSLSPLALAFVAGYSVELLFSIMDRVIPSSTGDRDAA